MIEIKNAILHILDANSNVKVIADYEMDIDDDAQWQSYVDGLYALGLEDWMDVRGIEKVVE